MLSIPPATLTSLVPAMSRSCANIAAFIPEPHILFTVVQPADSGRPAPSDAWRAGACPCPAGSTQPMITSCTWSGLTLERSIAARIAAAPSCGAAKSFSSPCSAPIGVRAAETMTIGSLAMTPPRTTKAINAKVRKGKSGKQILDKVRSKITGDKVPRLLRHVFILLLVSVWISLAYLCILCVSSCVRRTAGESVAEAQGLRVRKHVFDMSGGDAPLDRVPVVGVEQVGVVFEEYLAHPWLAQQECSELFGEHVVGADRVPGLRGDLVFRGTRRRHTAERTIRHVGDLVVVVEHHAAEACQPEILEQHVARKNVRRRELLDGIAVIADGTRHLIVVGAVQMHVERHHSPFDVHMLDDQRIAFLFDHGRRERS